MDWQITLTWCFIGLAVGYLGWCCRRAWRASKTGCAGGCGCTKEMPANTATPPAIIPADQLVMRAKR